MHARRLLTEPTRCDWRETFDVSFEPAGDARALPFYLLCA